MSLQEDITRDLQRARKQGNKKLTSDLGIIVGELARLKGTKINKIYVGSDLSDEQVLTVLKGIVKSEQKTCELLGMEGSRLLEVVTAYLPDQISEKELRAFLDTLDFSKFKHKNMAIGVTKKHFGDSVDGKLVNKVIQEY